jgi:altronate dehydratase
MTTPVAITPRDNVATALEPIAPGAMVHIADMTIVVIKITGNTHTARSMADNIDVDVSGVLTSDGSIDRATDRLLEMLLAVCQGKPTATERLGHREFAIHRRNPTI